MSFTAHIVLICALQFADFQIFSGCVCHLEQRHAQSPFLFPIVFSINLIPFFDICSVIAALSPGLFGYYTTLAKKIETGTQAQHRRVHARQITRLCHLRATVAVCGFGSWSLVFHCGMARQISPLPSSVWLSANTINGYTTDLSFK